jgi:manganese transport protein
MSKNSFNNKKIILNWRLESKTKSMSEVNSSIKLPSGNGFRRFFAFAGPGLLIAVGYMDPGNWATDIEGGSRFGYTLLSIIFISNLSAMLLQHLSLKLGIVAERDLAQACRDSYSKATNLMLWILTEIAIIATDLAEVLGAAIAMNLLFGLPLVIGVCITIFDVFLILYLQSKSFRLVEILVALLISVIFFSFLYEIIVSNPNWSLVLSSILPQKEIISNKSMLYIAIGIIGATVMPHNLYLHSSIVQTRDYERNDTGKKEAIKFATIDSTVSLGFAFFVNAAILLTAASTFYTKGMHDVVGISDAYKLLNPVLGVKYAALFFGIALLASGINSTFTGTLAGQIVMEGFLNLKLKPYLRRLITRGIAVIPGVIAIIYYGEAGVESLLVFSQVVLSLQLPFAIIPLLQFTSSKSKMGEFVNPMWVKSIAIVISLLISCLGLLLLIGKFF